MPINGVNKKRQQSILQGASVNTVGVFGDVHAQPPAFRATGKGFFNRLPDFTATEHNANGAITNRATPQRDDGLYKLYLFVNAIQTGWSLAGETAQGQFGRVFYPRNLSQDEFVIEGICANQYEHDKIVRFVEHHHNTQFSSRASVAQSLDGNDNYPGVDFMLFKPVNSALNVFAPMKYQVVITDMAAGAEKFKYAREYTLQCKVIYDYLQRPFHLEDDINKRVTRQQVFGAAVDPSPRTAANPATQTSPTSNAKSDFNQR